MPNITVNIWWKVFFLLLRVGSENGEKNMRQSLLKPALQQVQVPEMKYLSKLHLRTPKAPFKAINANIEKVPVMLGRTESI